jgi:transposase-like protein
VGKVQCPGCTKKLDVVEFTGDEDDENYVCSKCGKRWLILQTNYTPKGAVIEQHKVVMAKKIMYDNPYA